MISPLTLYYAPDNASLCVRLALEELGLPYETALVDRGARAQKSAAYLALNPNGLIPVLATPAGPIHETGAILLWLADQRPGVTFPMPDAKDRGRALTRLFWLANTLHPTLRMGFYPDQYSKEPASLAAGCAMRLADHLTILESCQERWLDADAPSILACYLAPMLRWAALYGSGAAAFDLATYPRLMDFARKFEARAASGQAAMAEGLGDFPFSAPVRPNPPEGSAL